MNWNAFQRPWIAWTCHTPQTWIRADFVDGCCFERIDVARELHDIMVEEKEKEKFSSMLGTDCKLEDVDDSDRKRKKKKKKKKKMMKRKRKMKKKKKMMMIKTLTVLYR